MHRKVLGSPVDDRGARPVGGARGNAASTVHFRVRQRMFKAIRNLCTGHDPSGHPTRGVLSGGRERACGPPQPDRTLCYRGAMRRILLTACLLAATATIATAQSSSYSLIGGACPSAPVRFDVIGTPMLGGAYTIQTDSPVLSQFSRTTPVLATGLSSTQFGGVALPFDLSALSTPTLQFCGSLVTSIDVQMFVPFGGEMTFAIPNVSSLVGLNFYQQVLKFTTVRLSGITFVETSPGGHGVIGA